MLSSNANLFFSFGLPITETDKTFFETITYANGGFSNTAISDINQDKVLVIAIDNSMYGELLDGKSIKITIVTSATTFTLYGTYKDGEYSLLELDGKIKEGGKDFSVINPNITFLFSDQISPPNQNEFKSWATGWGRYKPFSVNGKQTFNLVTNSSLDKTKDIACGIAYLDKGFIVITEPSIVNSFVIGANDSDTVIETNSIYTTVIHNVQCISNRGEFGSTTNSTYTKGNKLKLSEVTIMDENDNIIAVGKTDRHIETDINGFFVLTLQIVV